jgi:hypothetical protein
MSATTQCPHCGAANPFGSQFCQTCGKALPDAYGGGGPRVVTADSVGASTAGRELLGDQLRKKMNQASGALLAVAIIQVVFGAILIFALQDQARRAGGEIPPLAYVLIFGLGAAFFGLWAWSRFQPFAAAIVGLVLYVSVWVMDIVADPEMIFKGILLKLIIVAVLVKAIQAGSEYRKLQEQMMRERGGRM